MLVAWSDHLYPTSPRPGRACVLRPGQALASTRACPGDVTCDSGFACRHERAVTGNSMGAGSSLSSASPTAETLALLNPATQDSTQQSPSTGGSPEKPVSALCPYIIPPVVVVLLGLSVAAAVLCRRHCRTSGRHLSQDDIRAAEVGVPQIQPIMGGCQQGASRPLAGGAWHPLREARTSFKMWRHKQGLARALQGMALMELIKDGKHGQFYRARLSTGSRRGHKLVTCKIGRRGLPAARMELEVRILTTLGYHKHILQLLEWNMEQEPYVLILEHAGLGTLRTFLRSRREQLRSCGDLQALLTMVAYHISLGMKHIADKQASAGRWVHSSGEPTSLGELQGGREQKVLHRDLALRNILVSAFPHGCKITEFGLARELGHEGSLRHPKVEVPLRWYPPEYFRESVYGLAGDVWAFGIVLWEMEMLGCSPYPYLDNSETVMFQVCSGYRMSRPPGCRQQISRLMEQCWADDPRERPPFSAIAQELEDIVEEDADYLQLEDSRQPQGPSLLPASLSTAGGLVGDRDARAGLYT
ncbi:PREDICTED: tyrosine kinase receptor Cad96Ca-like [Gavialis gangeticus]|uniref:tyrosine kinase receptor Cad96Ca-like n=1 Tax=Gavialis gangeticus TaxID=94835 RepID=UPI00092EB4B8|nr:PREDICTED: tyrosine kinase receptor Cad96Ca-like [Gavialis gangeticus]